MEIESLYGVKVPKISAPDAGGGLSFSPIGVGAKTLEAATAFRRLTEAIIAVANTENRLRKIGEEIKKTNRRVNALEQISIPEINEQIKFITDTLDQRALEEVTTLKRIKPPSWPAKPRSRASSQRTSRRARGFRWGLPPGSGAGPRAGLPEPRLAGLKAGAIPADQTRCSRAPGCLPISTAGLPG